MLVDLSQIVGGYLHKVFVVSWDGWVILGFLGQGLFTARFLVQWIASEKAGRSVIPLAFWFFSLGGGGAAADLRALSRRSGLYPWPGTRHVYLRAQSHVDPQGARQAKRRGVTRLLKPSPA